jgi:uncharacterized membrane protein
MGKKLNTALGSMLLSISCSADALSESLSAGFLDLNNPLKQEVPIIPPRKEGRDQFTLMVPRLYGPKTRISVKSDAGWRICNLTSENEVSIALAHYDEDKWISRGWTTIQHMKCTTVLRTLGNRYVYYIARADRRSWLGDTPFCTNPTESFSHSGNNCSDDLELRSYRRVDTGQLTSFTTILGD